MSCDNIPSNGALLESLLVQFIRLLPAKEEMTLPKEERPFKCNPLREELCDAIDEKKICTFPCCMVDRIVPATTQEDLDETEKLFGFKDYVSVFTEPCLDRGK